MTDSQAQTSQESFENAQDLSYSSEEYLEKIYGILDEIIKISESSVITNEMGSINRGNIIWFIQANQAKRLEEEINLLVNEAYPIID